MTITAAPPSDQEHADQEHGRQPLSTAQRVLVVACIGASLAVAALTVPLLAPVRELGIATPEFESLTPIPFVELLLGPAVVTVGAAIVLRGWPRTYGWYLLFFGLWAATVSLATEYALLGWYGDAPGPPAFTGAAIEVQDLWMVPHFMFFLVLPSTFPDGRPPDRWRRPFVVVLCAAAVLVVLNALTVGPPENAFLDADGTAPLEGAPENTAFGILPIPLTAVDVTWLLVTVAGIVVAIGSLVSRWRRAGGVVRQQLKWVLYAFAAALFTWLALWSIEVLFLFLDIGPGISEVIDVVYAIILLGVVVAAGLGVLKYRLFEVDLVLNRTLVYTATTGLVLGVYAVTVALLGQLLDVGESGSAITATAIVAILFEPVRRRIQRVVNRAMFGRRDDPFAVLSDLGDVLVRSADPAATLAAVPVTVTEALRVPGAAVELAVEEGWDRRASAGELGADPEEIELGHRGEVVGRLLVARRSPGERLHDADQRLLDGIAAQTGALLHGMRLTVELQRSREQLVAAREEERRRLRRDLHDGLGPTLASQTFQMDAVARLLGDDAPEAAALLRTLKQRNTELVAEIRRLVHELRPPALDELGLVGALAAHAGGLSRSGRLEVRVTADPDPLGPLPAAVEVAAYRIASEAVTNVVRHAEASTCLVEVRRGDDRLVVRVTDDGIGIRAVTAPGVGLGSMRERAQELGGRCSIDRGERGGTVVVAELPLTTGAHDDTRDDELGATAPGTDAAPAASQPPDAGRGGPRAAVRPTGSSATTAAGGTTPAGAAGRRGATVATEEVEGDG